MIDPNEPLNYKPDYYDGVYEMEELLKAEGVALNKLDVKRNRTLLNYFVLHTDTIGISIFENELGIIPEPEDTLLQRQQRVLAWKLPPAPITIRYLRHLIKVAGIPVDATVDYAHRQLNAKAIDNKISRGQIATLNYMLSIYLPANMGYETVVEMDPETTTEERYFGFGQIVEEETDTLVDKSQMIDEEKDQTDEERFIGFGSYIKEFINIPANESEEK